MTASFPVIYLTGAPASGKSTLARNLAAKFTNLRVFAYSEELRQFIGRRSCVALSEDKIRELSGVVVTADDVQALDRELVALVAAERGLRPVLIDSHPVTKERYGFRVTGFDEPTLQALDPDYVVCLYTSPEVILGRIARDPMGRPAVSEFEAEMHTQLQVAVAAQYGILLGKPVYLIDSSVEQEELVEIVARRTKLGP